MFHAEQLCLGVERSIIEVLLQVNGPLSYKCCRCRGNSAGRGNSQDGGGLSQLLNIVGGLVAAVRNLTPEFSSGHSRVQSP